MSSLISPKAFRALTRLRGGLGLLVAAVLAQAASPSHPSTPVQAPPGGRVVFATVNSVQDGDSLTVKLPGQAGIQRVRLAGLDAPELEQPFGAAARDSLRALALKREVRLACHKQDRYQRWVCRAQLTSPPGLDLSREQLLRGMAWQDQRFQAELPAALREADARAQAQARARQLGLFSRPNPIPPWQWRRTRAGSPLDAEAQLNPARTAQVPDQRCCSRRIRSAMPEHTTSHNSNTVGSLMR